MTIRFNEKLLMWGVGVIQPATPEETINFLKLVYPAVSQWPTIETQQLFFDGWVEKGYVLQLNKKDKIYSLASGANGFLGQGLRKQRDKARLTLLRFVYDASIHVSEDVEQVLDGASPSSEGSFTSQEGSRPVSSGFQPSPKRMTRLKARTYWPRVAEQLESQVGFDFHTSDISSIRYKYYSFHTLNSLQLASPSGELERDMTTSQLALAIGVSPGLLTSFTHKKENHYRRFTIGKKGGGDREIASPRFFLKTVHYWLKCYLLWQLKIHHSSHAYTKGKSIITNASVHVGQSQVANIDIENFFGSITQKHVFNLLRNHDFGQNLASIVARLTTLDDALPQGAPTSPVISNAILYEFDEIVSKYTKKRGLFYTRYADDLTISGADKGKILSAINYCRRLLKKDDFYLKESKTRIASSSSSQRVTGLVVNEILQPPRGLRRRVRAMIFNAYQKPEEYVDRLDELRGYISYLSSFDSIKATKQLKKANLAIAKIVAAQQR